MRPNTSKYRSQSRSRSHTTIQIHSDTSPRYLGIMGSHLSKTEQDCTVTFALRPPTLKTQKARPRRCTQQFCTLLTLFRRNGQPSLPETPGRLRRRRRQAQNLARSLRTGRDWQRQLPHARQKTHQGRTYHHQAHRRPLHRSHPRPPCCEAQGSALWPR
jgi:hypothetical protein